MFRGGEEVGESSPRFSCGKRNVILYFARQKNTEVYGKTYAVLRYRVALPGGQMSDEWI